MLLLTKQVLSYTYLCYFSSIPTPFFLFYQVIYHPNFLIRRPREQIIDLFTIVSRGLFRFIRTTILPSLSSYLAQSLSLSYEPLCHLYLSTTHFFIYLLLSPPDSLSLSLYLSVSLSLSIYLSACLSLFLSHRQTVFN